MSAGYPLDGITVVDLTQYVAGPYATQVLADLGARVIKVERPGRGDVYRTQGPVFLRGLSASFLTLNRGKESVAIDITDAAARDALRGLVGEADVLVENMKPGTLARYGLDYDSLRPEHPRLVYCSLSAYGQVGPQAQEGGYDLTLQALSGIMAMTGHPGGPPAKVPVAALDFGTAIYGVIGVLAALRSRDLTGEGQWVQASLLETAVAWLSMHTSTYLISGEEPGPEGTRSPFFAPYEAYETADGHIVLVGTGGKQAWMDLCLALGRPDLAEDARFAENAGRVEHAELIKQEIERVTRTRETAHWEAVMREARVPYAPVRRLPAVLEGPQLKALDMIRELEHPTAGPVPITRLPITFDRLAATARTAPPVLGDELR